MNIDDKKNLLVSLFISLLISAVLSNIGFFERSQYLLHDGVQKYWGDEVDYSDILIVDIDEPSIQALRSQLGSWPYNRHIFSSVTSYLERSGASQIVFDILFADSRDGDEDFSEKLKANRNIHLAAILLHDYLIDNKEQSALLQNKYWEIKNPPDIKSKGALFPNELLLNQANIGLISVIPAVDGVVRSIPLVYRIDKDWLPSMALSVIGRGESSSLDFNRDTGTATTGKYTWPVDEKGMVTIKYPKNLYDLPVIPFYKLLLSAFGDTKNGLPDNQYKDKTIFIGSTATVLGDYTYVPNEGRIYGLGLLAHIYHSLEHGNVLNSNSLIADLIICLPWLLILAGIISIRGINSVALYIGLVAAAILSAVLVIIQYKYLSTQAWYVIPAFSSVLFVVVTTLIKTITLQLEKTKIHLEHMAAEEARALRERYLVYHDLLTELPNRALFVERANDLISSLPPGGRMSFMLIDLDRFKTINDAMGHEVGDQILLQLSKRFRKMVSESGNLARLGGDEFIVMHESTGDDQLISGFAHELLRTAAMPIHVQSQQLYVTASIGISCYPADGEDVGDLLKNAEIAMYRAKEMGSNNYQYYSEDINVSDMQKLSLENDLRTALENNQFKLVYQPKVSIDSQEIVGVEALIRWEHPKLGVIGPTEFVPLLEVTNLIIEVGDWIISTACQQLHDWKQQGIDYLVMAINISGRQFNSDSFVDHLEKQVEKYNIPASAIELEITENILMEDYQTTSDCLRRLYNAGFSIAIDDFGTGYSSLSYLRKFQINVLKIDKSFIDDIAFNRDSQAIVETIIAMAEGLNLKTVAEGVETEEQLEFLRTKKCHIAQGYYYSRPIPAPDVLALIDQSKAKKM